MLVVSRKEGERIRIGQDITIVVGKRRGERVRIGIEAPAGVRVLRTELLAGDRDGRPKTPGGKA